MRTTKVQTSMWSAQSEQLLYYYLSRKLAIYMQFTFKSQASLCSLADWFEHNIQTPKTATHIYL